MNLFDLYVTIGAKDEASGAVSKISAATVAAGHLMADAAKAAGSAIINLGKQAISGYSDYEQLVGGVETLFKDSADAVMGYAENAYKTSGLSANEYMSTVTSFSASLLQSLGGDTKEAARMADQAIIDMADNANKMGTDMSMIQNAYSGFAKQNFTMLDNLKLGYGGTQAEMQRLLEDAEAISGIEYDISSYADIVEAIHVIQTEMGITGTTAKEASETIEGSVQSAKAAWSNLVTGIADENANLEQLTDNFVDSVKTAAENVLPIVGNVLGQLGGLLEEKGPEMVVGGAKLLGKLAVGAVKAIPNIVSNIPEIVKAIGTEFQESGPEFEEMGKDIVRGLWNGIKSLAGWIGDKVGDFFGGVVNGAKNMLGIHSPSRVFAGIGENMALGVGVGWDSEFRGVRRDINSGLDFGTAHVGFAESGLGMASAGMVNGIASAGNAPIQLTAKFYWSDGREMSSLMLGDLIQVAKANGTPIVNPG